MANQFKFTDWLGQEALRRLLNKLTVTEYFNTDNSKLFSDGVAKGASVRIPFPQRFIPTDGLGYQPQPLDMRETTVNCNRVKGVHFEVDSLEQALKMPRPQEYIRENIINPAMDALAQQIDSDAAQFAYQNTSNIVGVLGTNPSSFTTIGQVRERMIQMAAGTKKKAMLITPAVNTAMVGAAQQFFNDADEVSRQYREGSMGRNNGFDWFESMSLYSHTAGTWASAVTVNTAPANGDTSLVVNCTSGDTFKKGDVIGIDAVYPVNPMTRRTFGSSNTKQFVITQDTTASASTATIYVYPAFEGPTSQYANVDALPLANAALTLFPGTTSPNGKSGMQNLALTADAFALVGVKLETPDAAEISVQKRDPASGLSVRFVKMFDPVQSKMVNRFDVAYGFGVLYGDNCSVRLLSA